MPKILLIEKDGDLAINWRELFKVLKYEVRYRPNLDGVKSVSELVNKYFTNVDVVIADTDVVGLDGLKLKAIFNNDFKRIPIVFVSADNVPPYSLTREELSAIAFLQKPFDNSLLLEFVSKALKVKKLIEDSADSQKVLAKLLLSQPGRIPVEYVLKRSYTLGRFRNTDEFHADIQLLSPSASRKHAYLIRTFCEKESYYKLLDLSSNGILLNGKKCPKLIRLNHQDVIQFYPECSGVFSYVEREEIDLDSTLTQEE